MRTRTKYLLILILLFFTQTIHAEGGRFTRRSLANTQSFAFALGLDEDEISQHIAALGRHDLIVVDGQQATPEQISDMQSSGSVVLGYLSVGTIEKGRPWYPALKKFRLDFWEDWGEWFAAVNEKKYRRILLKRAAGPILEKGFDGLFLDNVDMIVTHPKQKKGMQKLVQKLSSEVQSRSKLLFAQNGDEIINWFLPYLDGWNREDVSSSYNFKKKSYQLVDTEDSLRAQQTLLDLAAHGLLTLTTDYTEEAESADSTNAARVACAVGAVPFIGNIQLKRIPHSPLTCPHD